MLLRRLCTVVSVSLIVLPLPALSTPAEAGANNASRSLSASPEAGGPTAGLTDSTASPPAQPSESPASAPAAGDTTAAPSPTVAPHQAARMWRATLWGGTMVDEDLLDNGVNLDLFLARGQTRNEAVYGLGLQRQLWGSRNGISTLLVDANLLGHSGRGQQNGRYADADRSYSDPQTFLEATLGLAFKLNPFPWLGLSVIEGLSGLSALSNYEATYRKEAAQVLNYLAFEAEVGLSKQLAAVFRIHHRSGVGGVFSGVTAGSNGYLGGLRLAF